MKNIFQSDAKHFLSIQERDEILNAIKSAESTTSGEIRIFIETHCKLVDTVQRAEDIFATLKMHKTINRNGILIYIAFKDREFAVFGDMNCIIKFPKNFWKETTNKLSVDFYNKNYKEGILSCIKNIQAQLATHFPNIGTHKNELPDEIVFGK